MTGTNLINYEAQFAASADAYAAEEPASSGHLISTRGGILRVGEEPLPGNQMCVIVLDAVRENTYYPTKYNPDVNLPPTCYAFGRTDAEMGPHPTMQADLSYFAPQHSSCTGCPMAEWGSADTGRGKACSNRRRLALLPAGMYTAQRGSRDFALDLIDDPRHFETAETAFLKLPVTSVREWTKYVQFVTSTYRRGPYGVVTRIFLEPDPKSQFRVGFEFIELVQDKFAGAIIGRHNQAVNELVKGYQPPSEEERSAPQTLRGAAPPRR